MGLILKYYGLLTDLVEVDSDVLIEREIPTEELFGELDRIAKAVKNRQDEAERKQAEADRERETTAALEKHPDKSI